MQTNQILGVAFFPRTKTTNFLGQTVTAPWNDAELSRFVDWCEANDVMITTANQWPRQWHRTFYTVRNGLAVAVERQEFLEDRAGSCSAIANAEPVAITLKRGNGFILPAINGTFVEGLSR